METWDGFGGLGIGRERSQALDALEFLLDGSGKRKWIKTIAQQFHGGGLFAAPAAGEDSLQRRLRGVIDARQPRTDSGLALELDRGQEQVLEQAQFVAVEFVDCRQSLG